MKKLLILGVSVLAFALMLCVGLSAKEYHVSSYDELGDAFSEINSKYGEDSTIIFDCDITGSYGFGVTYPFEVTVDLNTFKFTVTQNQNSIVGSAFYTNNDKAVASIKNGSIEVNDVCFWPAKGRVIATDVDIYTSKEELVWWGADEYGDIILDRCTLEAKDGVVMESKGGCSKTHGRLVQIIDCTIENGAVTVPCPAPGSIVKNSTFSGGLKIDAWHHHDGFSSSNVFEIEVIGVTASSLSSLSGACYVRAIDCTINSYSASKDGSGDSKITVIDSPTCSKTGLETVCNVGSTSEPTTLDIVPHSALSTDCTADVYCSMCGTELVYAKKNDAHNIYYTTITYAKGFNKPGEKIEKCTDCEGYSKAITLPAIFDAKGYTSKDTTGFGTGFSLNIEALEEYEASTGKTLCYGIVAFNPKFLKEGDSFFVDGMANVSKGVLQVEIKELYRTFSLLITGFTPEMDSLELVFAGYVYESDNKSSVQLFQKEYGGSEETPMKTQVVKDTVLHTITISTVCTPVKTGGKAYLDEYTSVE